MAPVVLGLATQLVSSPDFSQWISNAAVAGGDVVVIVFSTVTVMGYSCSAPKADAANKISGSQRAYLGFMESTVPRSVPYDNSART